MGVSTSQTTLGLSLPIRTVGTTANVGWRLRFSQTGNCLLVRWRSESLEGSWAKMRTAETTYQIISGRADTVHPLSAAPMKPGLRRWRCEYRHRPTSLAAVR
jgi:hypothetical protein